MTSVSEHKKMTFAVALALIGGVMMIAGGITTLVVFEAFQSMFGGGYMMILQPPPIMTPAHFQYMYYAVSVISIAVGAVVFALGYKIWSRPEATRDYGIVILIASIAGMFTASGFGMGAILGIVAGIIAIAKK